MNNLIDEPEMIISDCCEMPIEDPFFFCEECLRHWMIDGICFRTLRQQGKVPELEYKQLLRENADIIDKCLNSFGLNNPK